MSEKKILRTLESNEGGPDYAFWCPGCKCAHGVWVTSGPTKWSFNGNMGKPTFSPSILVTGKRDLTEEEYQQLITGVKNRIDLPNIICHTFVRDGMIQYLGDCTHEFAGKTIPMEPF